jgi:hypothetical protein
MLASLRAFFFAWLGKDGPFLTWLLGHFGIVTEVDEEEGKSHADR